MKKIMAKIMALSMVVVLLAACGAKPASTPTSAPAEKVEITAWLFPTMQAKGYEAGAYEKELVEAYNASQDTIIVKFEMIDFQNGPEKITTSIEGGTAPDIVFDAPGRIIEWGKAGNLAPLDDMFTAEYKADMLIETLLGACSDGTNYFMYPVSAAPFTMAFNKAMCEEAGVLDLLPTTGDRTWSNKDYLTVVTALKAKGFKGAELYCGGQGGDQGTRAYMTNLFNASITKSDLSAYNMDTPEGIKAAEFVMQGINEGWIEPNTAGVANDALDHFDQGLVSSTVLWGPGLATQRDKNLKDNNVEAISVCLPSEDGTPTLEYLVNGFCVFDNKDEAKIAASKEFIKFVCDDAAWGPKNVVATGCFPVRSSFGDLYPGNPEMAYYAGLTKYYGTYYNTIDGYAAMRPFWWGSLQAMITGEKTPEEAMKSFTAEGNKTIAED